MRMKIDFVLLVQVLILIRCSCGVVGSGRVRCREEEKNALLDFKLSFTADPDGLLSDWTTHNHECCQWNGVMCDDGHVTTLDMSEFLLESHQLRPSLLLLPELSTLDFSYNSFIMRIPEFIGSLTKLTDLGLSHSGFYGKIPPHFGNLTNLQYLWFASSSALLHSDNLQWLSHLSSMQVLDLSGINLSNAADWLITLKMLPSLSVFSCSSCSLPLTQPPVTSLCLLNHSTSLKNLDLSYNNISPVTFSCLTNGSNHLIALVLAYMNSEQHIHEYLKALEQNSRGILSLETLDISNNLMTTLSNLSNFTSLTDLDASFNKISDNLHSSLQQLPTSLSYLDLSSNSLDNVISNSHLSKFSNLQSLDLSDNNLLKFNFSRSWVPPFNLTNLSLRSCKLGPQFPNWVLTHMNLEALDISNSSISGAIPNAFWDEITKLQFLNFSHNRLQGTLPNLSAGFLDEYSMIDLSSNDFHGSIPLFLYSGSYLDLSNNSFSSFSTFHHKAPKDGLWVINLSNNLLSGSLPGWIFHIYGLRILNLANNKLSGDIPRNVSLRRLTALHMTNNRFSGELPSSMKKCTRLMILELGNNNFSGRVPFWIGDNLHQLFVLNLRSNNFTMDLPFNLCHLQRLQVLDLSGNRISGSIPDCVNNFTTMTTDKGSDVMSLKSFESPSFGDINLLLRSFHVGLGNVYAGRLYIDFASIMWKGILAEESSKNLQQRNVIDLSDNCLTGIIPNGFTSLKYLRSLDLSRNNLIGSIPDNIGQIKFLEVLKLPSNTLCGEIPQSLADITFLSELDLSSNNLSGRIPKGTQLQSFDPSFYAGNPELCGDPLPTKCPGDNDVVSPKEEDEASGNFDMESFYAALGTGFAFGLLGIMGVLHFHAPFRHAFFHMASAVGDWIFVKAFLCQSRIKRRLRSMSKSEAAGI